MADFDRLDKAVEAVNNAKVPAGPSQDLANRTLLRLQVVNPEQAETGASRRPSRWAPSVWRLWPAAAAAILVAGFLVGRMTQPAAVNREDLVTLEQSLHSRLQQTLIAEVQAAQAQTYQRLISDVTVALDRRLPLVAGEVLNASNNTTSQIITGLIQIIQANQIQQQKEFTAALEWIESDRLRKQAQLSTSFASFAVATEQSLRQTTEDLARLAGRQGTDELPRETNQSSNQERN